MTGRSIVITQRKYRQHFNARTITSRNMIRNLITQNKICRSVHNKEAVQAVRRSVKEDSSVSTRRRTTQLGIMKLDLKKFPEKI